MDPDGTRNDRVLVVGNPRSGTTWVAEALGHCPGVHYVHEPDDERYPYAPFGTGGLGHLPDLRPGDRAPRYGLLWDIAFAGGWPHHTISGPASRVAAMLPLTIGRAPLLSVRRATHRRHRCRCHVVKSVRLLFGAEWVADRTQARVLVVMRSPLNMLPGWLGLGWGSHGIDDHPNTQARLEPLGLWPAPPGPGVENTAWTLCARNYLMLDTASRHPTWQVVWHEDLCADPPGRFRDLASALALPWSGAVSDYLEAANRPGTGWEVQRVASEEIEGWRKRLTEDQVRVAAAVIDRFEAATGRQVAGREVATAG